LLFLSINYDNKFLPTTQFSFSEVTLLSAQLGFPMLAANAQKNAD